MATKKAPLAAPKPAAPKPAAPKPRAKAAKPRTPRPNRAQARPFTQEAASEILRRFATLEPHPKGELEHTSAFTLLVAVVLSAQATDAGVNKATRALFAAADTPEKMAALGEDRVRDFIKTVGLFRTKAKNVILLSEQLIARHGSEVPAGRDALEALPGVGRKTANVVLNMAFGQPTMAVDTHVFRVAHRIGLSRGKTPEAVEADLIGLVAPEYGLHAHHWFILHGRYLCKARTPECWRCPISDLCRFEEKTAGP